MSFYRLDCHHCSKPIPLLNTTLDESGATQRRLPTDAGTLQVVCPHCNGAFRYQRDEVFVDRNDSGSNPDTLSLANKVPFEMTISCGTKPHRTLYTAISLQDEAAALDAAILCVMKAKPPVCCELGHPIQRGQSITLRQKWV
jgi:hypothetical protein